MRIIRQPARPPRVCLALGGGGARGIAHLGAIAAVRETSIEVERFVGVSIGALAGALCAFDPNIDRVISRTTQYLTSAEFRAKQEAMFGTAKPKTVEEEGLFAWYERVKGYLRGRSMMSRIFRRPSLLPAALVRDIVECLVPDADISDTDIPLNIVAVDLLTGHRVVLQSGPVRDAILASTAIPGIFPPVEFDGMLLCDIGVFESLPTAVAASYARDLTFAVDVGPDLGQIDKCETALDVLMRMDEIAERQHRRETLASADLVIRPEVSDVQWFDFTRPDHLIDAGRRAGRAALDGFRRRELDQQSQPQPRWWSSWWGRSA